MSWLGDPDVRDLRRQIGQFVLQFRIKAGLGKTRLERLSDRGLSGKPEGRINCCSASGIETGGDQPLDPIRMLAENNGVEADSRRKRIPAVRTLLISLKKS